MTKLGDSFDAKPALRVEFKRKRAALTATEWRERSLAIVEHVQRHLETTPALRVALYAPIEVRREVDVRPLDAWLRTRGASVAYPVMHGDSLGFAWVQALPMTTQQGFWQPEATSALLMPGELDWIVVPALAATADGYRLGYGSGFYDRALSLFCPPARSLCVVFESQLRATLPLAPHDVPCHAVITERGLVSPEP